MKIFKCCAIAAFSFFLQACFNSDDHIFDESESIDIKIDATLARSISETTAKVKADTFHVSDTIYILTTINPSKLIKVQDYHWFLDGKYCSSEYNFKKQISELGHHKFLFELKDHFGDMHYDSLDVWIADNPTLNDSVFTPANGTQAIDPYEAIYFTWSAKTEGIKLAHYYHFTLSEQHFANVESSFATIDTILYEPNFTFHNKLSPFTKYNWTVQAYNEYNLASAKKINSSFFTKGFPGEGSIQATIDIGQATSVPIHLTLLNKNNQNKHFDYSFKLTASNNVISLGSIEAGTYQLSIRSNYPDFSIVNKDIKVNDGFVTLENNLKLVDAIAPTIKSTTGHDTLDFTDSLQFIVKDGNQAISSSRIKVYLDNEIILNTSYKDSILTVILKESDKSWAYRILTVSATDESENISNKSFYIAPGAYWFTTNNDTTITSDQTISFFIHDNNPIHLAVDTLQFFNVTKNKLIISIPNSSTNTITAELEASLFDAEQIIRSTVIYKNGLRQNKTWKLFVKSAATKEEE